MKTRFLRALLHELPGTHFQSAVAQNRIRRRLRIFGTAAVSSPRLATPQRADISPAPGVAHNWWRFTTAWREKDLNPSIPAVHRKRLFQTFTSGFVMVVLLLLLAGCESGKPEPSHFSSLALAPPPSKPANVKMVTMTKRLDPTLLITPTNLFTLGPGDKLEIELTEETNSVGTTVVGPDGKIYYSLLPGMDVWGLTLGQTRDMIQHELAKYVRGRPQVNIILRGVESKHVWLLGRFQQPGVYNMSTPMTLLEAIAMAGGSQSFAGQRQISEGGPIGEDLADLRRSFIVRDGKMLPVDFQALMEKGDLSQNIYLQSDDFVYFSPAYAKEVYVLGAVNQPKPVQYVKGMTMLQAITGAYGTVRDAFLAHTVIVHGSLSQPQIAVVNYYDIVKGRAPDVLLEANDIVYVPFTPYRYLRKYLDTALDTFASSVAINAGTRAANGSATGISIPVIVNPTPVPPTPPIH